MRSRERERCRTVTSQRRINVPSNGMMSSSRAARLESQSVWAPTLVEPGVGIFMPGNMKPAYTYLDDKGLTAQRGWASDHPAAMSANRPHSVAFSPSLAAHNDEVEAINSKRVQHQAVWSHNRVLSP